MEKKPNAMYQARQSRGKKTIINEVTKSRVLPPWPFPVHCSSLAEKKGCLYVFKWRFGNFQKVLEFLKFGHYTKEFKP